MDRDHFLAGFVGVSFLVSLTLVGAYFILSGIFLCQSPSCSSGIWTGLFLVLAGILVFLFSLSGGYDTRYYLKR